MIYLDEYKPFADLCDCKYDTIVLTGGRGSGKTQHALRAILLAMVKKKKRVCFFRETKDTVTDSLMAEVEMLIETDFANRGFASTQKMITYRNGSHIFYKGLKEINIAAVENLKGIASSTDIFFIDEGQTISKAVWEVLIPTLRKAGSILIVAYNRIANNLPLEEELFLDYHNMSAPEGTFYTEVNYPVLEKKGLLSKRFLDRANLMRIHKPKEYAMIYLNQAPSEDDRAVVKGFTKDNIAPITYQPNMPLHLTWDFNVDPMSCILAHTTNGKIFYFDEFILENASTEQTIKEVIKAYPNHKASIIINGDASGDNRSTQSEWSNYVIIRNALRKHYKTNNIHLHLRPSNPRIKNRIAAFNAKVLSYDGQRCLFVDPKCEKLLYNIYNLKYKVGTDIVDVPTYTQIKTDNNLKFLEHPFDAASYLVEYYYPIKVE
jgi:PBSX family phage terminase large subunit